MLNIKKYNRLLLFVCITAAAVFIAWLFVKDGSEKVLIKNYRGQAFAGSASCRTCHKAIYDSFQKTAHLHTSSIATLQSVKGSFNIDSNTFSYGGRIKVVMEKRDSGLFQVGYNNGREVVAHRFEITTGSGILGQSYLYWNDNRLYQLPVSYYGPANIWCNSPGFSGTPVFSRTITPRCLECHTTYVKNMLTPDLGYAFDKNQVMYGVDCERCHGPGEQHVLYQTEHPSDKKASFIINAAILTRKQQLDACAICHAGPREHIQAPFTYAVGDDLSLFFAPAYNQGEHANLDVHGNKYELVTSSKCFLKSPQVTCSTCHNVHEQERGNLVLQSQRCMSCHSPEKHTFCTAKSVPAETMKTNCVDCHMPMQPSKALEMMLSEKDILKKTLPLLRTHLIKIYPEAYAAFIKKTDSR